MCKARHLRKYVNQEPGYNVDFTFDYTNDVVKATFLCCDDFADPRINHTAEDLEIYIIKKYGAFIISDELHRPTNYDYTQKKVGELAGNPLLRQSGSKQDSYNEIYSKILLKNEFQQLQRDWINFATPFKMQDTRIKPTIKPTSTYLSDLYKIDIGLWHG